LRYIFEGIRKWAGWSCSQKKNEFIKTERKLKGVHMKKFLTGLFITSTFCSLSFAGENQVCQMRFDESQLLQKKLQQKIEIEVKDQVGKELSLLGISPTHIKINAELKVRGQDFKYFSILSSEIFTERSQIGIVTPKNLLLAKAQFDAEGVPTGDCIAEAIFKIRLSNKTYEGRQISEFAKTVELKF
jgi:hypothetical protein